MSAGDPSLGASAIRSPSSPCKNQCHALKLSGRAVLLQIGGDTFCWRLSRLGKVGITAHLDGHIGIIPNAEKQL